MAITILPSWGDYVGKGLSEAGQNIGGYIMKKAELEAEEKKKTPFEILEEAVANDMAEKYNKEGTLTDESFETYMKSQGYPMAPESQQVQPTRQYTPDMGSLSDRPQVPIGEAMMAKKTGTTTDAMAKQVAFDEKQKKTKIGGAELWKASEQERQKTLSETFGKTSRAITALSNLVGYGKAVDEDIKVPEMLKGFSGAYRGAVGELGSFRYASDKLQKETKSAQAYRAQVSDILTSLTPIMSGQARWVQGLAEVVLKSIPNLSRMTEVREEIVAQTARSMLSLSFAVENGFLTEDIAKRFGIDKDTGELTVGQAEDVMKLIDRSFLTKDQEEQIEMAVDFILNTPAIRKGKTEGGVETDTTTQPTSGWSDEKENRLQELRKKLGR